MELEAKRSLFVHLTEEALEEYAFGRLPESELAPFETHLLHCEHCQERLEAEDNFIDVLHVLQLMNEPPSRSNPAARPNLTASGIDARSNPAARVNGDARSGVAVESQDLPTPSVAPTPPARNGYWTRAGFSTTSFTSRGFTPAWGAALLAVLVAGMCALRMPLGRGLADDAKAPGQTVTLTTLRGGAADGIAQGRAGRSLDLSIDISSLSTSRPEAGAYRLEVVDASGDPCWTGSVVPIVSTWDFGQIAARVDKPLREGTYWVRLYAPSGKLLREFGLHLD